MKKQYSQNEEERVILEYFGNRKGTFLSIGENDGITFSNVRALAERGWDGDCFEPSPRACKKLNDLYSDRILDVRVWGLAINHKDGPCVLHDSGSLINKGDTSLVSTLVAQEKKRFEKVTPYNVVEVQGTTWESFQKIYGIRSYNFISIDAEGMDLNILNQLWNRKSLNTSDMVCIEWNNSGSLKEHYDAILRIDQGMSLVYTSAENLIYAR